MISAGIVEVDLHGMNEWQARSAIDAALRRADKSVYRIRVIHGYRRGAVLRDMVRYLYARREGVIRVIPGENSGQTDLVLRELYTR